MNLGRSRRRSLTGSSSPLNVRGERNQLTASGERIHRTEAESIKRLSQQWQQRAFAYYDLLGEIKYAAQFYSRALSSLVLFAAKYEEQDDGRKEIVPSNDPTAVELLDRIQDPGGGRSGLLSSYGRLMFLAGESYLLCTQDMDTNVEQWEMLSTDELRVQGSTYARYRAPSLPAQEFREANEDDWEPLDENTAIAYRLWKRHPHYSYLADSTMQGVLDLCEELVLLTQAVRARTRSRMAGPGILFLQEAISQVPVEAVPDEDAEEDPFLADLIEAATTAIVDEGSAAAVAPIISRIPVPDGKSVRDMVYHLQISDPTQLYPETGLRRECIDRIAIGLDMPPEVLTGLADANHWTGWMIDDQTWKGHLQPLAQQLVDDLTAAYYRPALRQAGVADWNQYLIHYDAADIVNHPDRGKDAIDLYDRIAIGKRSLREAKGFDDADEPTEDERKEMIGLKVNDATLALGGDVTPPPPPPVPPGPPAADQQNGNQPDGATTGNEVQTGPPDQGPPPPPGQAALMGAAANGRVDRVLGASQLALHRAREVAGNRLKGLAKRDGEALELLDDVRPGQVAATLGRERVRALKAPSERELVAGARALIVDALRVFDLDDAEAETISDSIEQHAALTLYEQQPRPLPVTFENYLRGALKR